MRVFLFFFRDLDFFEKFFSLSKKYIALMGLNVVAQSAYEIFLQNQRLVYKYKLVTIMTLIMAFSSVVLSFLFILLCDDHAWGRVLGSQLPLLLISFGIYIYYFSKSSRINLKYCKYALLISVPYIFHLLSGVILSSSDRAMITRFCGTKANAMYSMAYNVGMFVNVIWLAFNAAYAPWLKASSYYLVVTEIIEKMRL